MKEKLFLLPGLMCDERLWHKLIPNLKNEFDVIPLSIPLKENLDEMVNELETLFPQGKVNLLGFSLGGYIASYFVSKLSHRINKLMVIAASGCDLPQDEIDKRLGLINISHHVSLKNLTRQKVLTLLDKKHHNDESIITLIQQMYKDMGESLFKQQLHSTLYRKDVLNDLKELNTPISFLYAKGDRLVNKEWLSSLNDSKHITQIALDNDSHMLPLEEPVILSKHIKSFFC